MREKQWLTKPKITTEFLAKFPEINPVVLQLLYNRGLTNQEKIDQFLNPDYGQDLLDPFLFNQMEKAVKRILEAIVKKEKIVVYGDYDADGVCSSAVMVEALKNLRAQVDVYIPFRETEGYGLNASAANDLAEKGTNLVITVDCGISNKKEVDVLNQKGVDVIITDHHHQPLEIPSAYAIINPNLNEEKYPFRSLAGCGVAFKVVQGLVKHHKNFSVKQLPEGFEKWLLDLVAIGTIADIQPLLEENRVLVKWGLVVLNQTKRLGILKLIEKMNNNLTTLDEKSVSWQITPRLNAAGRLNHASFAYQLLITEEVSQAEKMAEEINKTNQQRQQLTDKINFEAKQIIGEVKNQKILVVVGDGWPIGVVGLVAGRLTDEFNLPSLVISRNNGEITGSARSIAEFNVIEAIQKADQLLSRYGGHSQAAGFTLKNEKALKEFTKIMIKLANDSLGDLKLAPSLEIETQVKLAEVDWHFFEELKKFMPYGEKNPKPIFLATDLAVVEAKTVGQDNKHLRLMVKEESGAIKKTIGFGFGHWCDKLRIGDKLDLIFEVDVNEWNGNRELQLKIIDLKLKN